MNNLDPQTFFFDLPIYTPIEITQENWDDFQNLLSFHDKIDGYNPFIKEITTFKVYPIADSRGVESFMRNGGLNDNLIECLRNQDKFVFYVHYDADKQIFMKVGQYPSIADFHISQIKKYNKVLSTEKLKEFTRAIGLAANGVGIGSFVYLRRIFEDLIEEAHKQALNEQGWNEDDYRNKKIVDKIELLKSHLPSFLVENRSLYGILSVGIHSLKEEDCLAYFDVVKVGIELILDEKLEIFKKKLKIEEAKKKLAEVATKVNKAQPKK
jgi:hypothetical protein